MEGKASLFSCLGRAVGNWCVVLIASVLGKVFFGFNTRSHTHNTTSSQPPRESELVWCVCPLQPHISQDGFWFFGIVRLHNYSFFPPVFSPTFRCKVNWTGYYSWIYNIPQKVTNTPRWLQGTFSLDFKSSYLFFFSEFILCITCYVLVKSFFSLNLAVPSNQTNG